MRDKIDQRILVFIDKHPGLSNAVVRREIAPKVGRSELTLRRRIEYLIGHGLIDVDRESQMGRSLLSLTEKGCKILRERVAAQAEEA
jgi:DNA-binding MarR family transcriptional regulator